MDNENMESTEQIATDTLGSDFASSRSQEDMETDHDIRSTLNEGINALGELRVIALAIKAASDENNPLDGAERQEALYHASNLLSERIDALDDMFDFLEDYLAIEDD